MAIRGRPPGIPKSANSGKKANHGPNTKKMTTAETRAQIHDDLCAVYLRLGGIEWLYKIAKDYPLEFLRQGWTRLAPPIPRENPDITNQMNLTINNLSMVERARRVAFLLASAEQELIEPQPAIDQRPSIADEIDTFREMPSPSFGPEESPEPVDNKAEPLVRDTHEQTLETYRGSPAEWGRAKKRNLI